LLVRRAKSLDLNHVAAGLEAERNKLRLAITIVEYAKMFQKKNPQDEIDEVYKYVFRIFNADFIQSVGVEMRFDPAEFIRNADIGTPSRKCRDDLTKGYRCAVL
jgi:hypothetical protein